MGNLAQTHYSKGGHKMLVGKSGMRRKALLFSTVIVISLSFNGLVSAKHYEPTWRSLKQYTVPQWLKDGKFGIYTHWGPYAVPAFGPNATWYSHAIYMDKDSEQYKHHVKTYGPLTKFGYKDFIPMFKAEKFDADEWAELFKKAGARFAGPVAEHHDGFAMWDTKYSEWNAAKMGPKRDVVGELEKAIKKKGMKFVTAFHHAESWWFFPVWDKRFDCGDPKYSGLYGPIHEEDELPSKEFLDEWYGKIIEVIDKYDPDFIWYDFALGRMREDYRKRMVAYFYNKAEQRGKEVVITYKDHDLPPGVGIQDLELGQMARLTYHMWITDSSVDDQGAWGYVKTAGFKSVDTLVDNLVDRVSKNGFLLLNVGPKPDGTIPEGAKKCLLGIGKWLEVNGEAIYGTTPWMVSGEGPTRMRRGGAFSEEHPLEYTPEDIRFTVKGNVLYAICLGWPEEEFTIESFVENDNCILYESEIKSIKMLGVDKELDWEMTEDGLTIKTPDKKPCEHAFVFKIVRKDL